MLEVLPNATPAVQTTVAARDRRTRAVQTYRQRQRHGLAVLRVPIVEYDVVQALIEAKRLTVAQALDRVQVEHVVAEVVNEWAQRWLVNSCNR